VDIEPSEDMKNRVCAPLSVFYISSRFS